MIDPASMPYKSLNIKGKLFTFDTVKIMGVLNVTPDSFFDGDRYATEDQIRNRIHQLVEEGADIIDIGGQSTRPGAAPVSEEEELFRVIPALMTAKMLYPNLIISIDTFSAKVAETAVQYGADIINDVSSGYLDEHMLKTVAKLQVPYIVMHSRGNSQNMARLTDYSNITKELLQFFAHKVFELNELGIHDLVIDPGFGFAKNVSQNYELLGNIEYLQVLNKPILAGISRKSMIYKTLQISPDDALNGTSVLNTYAVLHGADMLRVHDVKEAKQVVELCKRLPKK